MRTTVRLPDALLEKAKSRAVKEGRTLTSLIEEGLHLVLKKKSKTESEHRILPPVSSATGGYQPGLTEINVSEIEGMEDEENFGRINRKKK